MASVGLVVSRGVLVVLRSGLIGLLGSSLCCVAMLVLLIVLHLIDCVIERIDCLYPAIVCVASACLLCCNKSISFHKKTPWPNRTKECFTYITMTSSFTSSTPLPSTIS